MNIKDMPIEELELMSLTDLTYMILKENKKSMNTPTLFREICNLLDYSDEQYASKIGDYYTSLNIDKRFVLLENNEWDISDNHSIEIVIDEEDEEETEEVEDDDIDDVEEENIDEMLEDDDIDDELEDLSIIDDEEDEDE